MNNQNTTHPNPRALWATHSKLPNGSPRPTTDFDIRLIAIKRAKNPLLEATHPLLRALVEMPEYLEPDDIVTLRSLLERELQAFQVLCEAANIRRDHMLGARYCLCTALDEIAAQTAWGKSDSGVAWIANGLATAFHEDVHGGQKIYLLIGRLMSDPDDHVNLLEVVYRILSYGFEGQYRHDPDGHRKHETVRKRLYEEIMSRREPVPVALSVGIGTDIRGQRMSFFQFPVWVTVVVLSIVLLVMFGYYKFELARHEAIAREQLTVIEHMRPLPAAPPLHLDALLQREIDAGMVTVDESGRHSTVTLRGDAMFLPGKAAINPAIHPLLIKVAGEMVKVPGNVTVRGYTDSVPVTHSEFTSNQTLSEARAIHVTQMLQSLGIPASRMVAVGMGDVDPIADNATAQGRAKNRRVEITVARS
ncbi:type VI secretion system protein TssL, long form [Trinickia sp. YCB016]